MDTVDCTAVPSRTVQYPYCTVDGREVMRSYNNVHITGIGPIQNTRHFLLESFVWEEAIRVTILWREDSVT